MGDALDDAGFTDLGSLEAAVARDINCLAYYGITTGRTADTFDPEQQRETLADGPVPVAGPPPSWAPTSDDGDGDADFGDIAELGEDRQTAIAALASNGIMGGRGDMAFDPGSDITRAEMAVALVALLRHANSPRSSTRRRHWARTHLPSAELDTSRTRCGGAPCLWTTPSAQAYELGITTGTRRRNLRPNDGVPRRNMASFIMRALAHSNLRPAGV